MRIVDGEVEVFGVDEELGLQEALLDDVLGKEELVGRLKGSELGQLLLGEIGVELVDGVIFVLLYELLAHLLQVVGPIGYLGIVGGEDLVVGFGGGEGIDEGDNRGKFLLLGTLDVLPGEQVGHLADLISNQRRGNLLLKVLQLPDNILVD